MVELFIYLFVIWVVRMILVPMCVMCEKWKRLKW
jgi:hypothetical protein